MSRLPPEAAPSGYSDVLLGQWAPPPVCDVWPGVLIEFAGNDILADAALPAAYQLNDWPVAAVYLVGGPYSTGSTPRFMP